jgi:PadR family transcriptional regulator PadR
MASQAPFRMTQSTQMVLRALLVNPTRPMYGLEIGEAAELPSGTIHPILARLEMADWVESRWEKVEPSKIGRPRRRYYRLSEKGVAGARIALAAVDEKRRRTVSPLRPATPGGGFA